MSSDTGSHAARKRKAPASRNLADFITDGTLGDVKSSKRGTVYTYEVLPGAFRDVVFFSDGTAVLRDPERKALPGARERRIPVTGSGRKVLPALLSIPSMPSFAKGIHFRTPGDETKARLEVEEGYLQRYSAPELAAGHVPGELDDLDGLQLLFLGLTTTYAGDNLCFTERLDYAGFLRDRLNSAVVPSAFREGQNPPLAGIPEELEPLCYISLTEDIIRGVRRAGELIAMIALVTENYRGTLAEYIQETSPVSRARVVWRCLTGSHRVDDESGLRLRGWENLGWWASLTSDDMASVREFTAPQLSSLILRGQTCESPGSVSLLVQLIEGRDPVASSVPSGYSWEWSRPWCHDPGLTDWAELRLRRILPDDGDREKLITSVMRETRNAGLPIATWAYFIRHAGELRGTPVSWWTTLAG